LRNRRRSLGVLATAVALALALTGCPGSSSDSGSVTTVAAPSAPSSSVVVSSHDGSFDPEAVYTSAAPGVVTIRSVFSGSSAGSILGGAVAQGSGFVISDAGEIATNAHVVTDAQGGGGPINTAKSVYVQFADRDQVAADIVGYDPNADVALLKVDPSGLDLKPLRLATNEEIRVGQPVAAIGSPFGEDRSLSVGIVSATDRSIQSLTKFHIEGAIQTDASINPGNSGGPLLDANGDVIGINQQILTSSGATGGGNEGVGFAVPIGLVAHSLDQLRTNGSASYAYIGVSTVALYPQLADRLGIPSDAGALIAKVVPGGPADDAGLRGSNQTVSFQDQQIDAGGDVIVAVDGHQVLSETDLPRLISRYSPGDTVTLEILRDGHHQTVDVKLAERPGAGG
jgi:S1-C subfamily serine protease